MNNIDTTDISYGANNNLNKSKKAKLVEYLYELDKKMSFIAKWPKSSLFVIILALILILLLNSKFFYANETFYNEIEPMFENNTILIDNIERDSPFYNSDNYEINKCNSRIIDLHDGNLKTAHEIIETSTITFIYM
jgi:hypothetical protein